MGRATEELQFEKKEKFKETEMKIFSVGAEQKPERRLSSKFESSSQF
jgi:hypothetical protein